MSANGSLAVEQQAVEVEQLHGPHRHACEVRYVAGLKSHVARSQYLQGVERRRGKADADRLRADTWALMQGVKAP